MVALRASAVAGAGSQRTTHHAVQVSRARTCSVTSVIPVPLGVTGNTPDSGSGESWFEPRRGNSKRDGMFGPIALRLSRTVCEYVSEYSRSPIAGQRRRVVV